MEMDFFLAEFNIEKRTVEEFTIPECDSLSLSGARICWKASSPMVSMQRLSEWTVFLWGAPQYREESKTSQELTREIAVSLSQGDRLHSNLIKLEGFFAILAWNEKNSELLFATDPIGMMKVYYREFQGRVVISSHAHLIARRFDDFTVSAQGLSLLFSLKGIPAPYTVFQRVSVLKPAELVSVSDAGRSSEEYWAILEHVKPFQGSFEDAQGELQDLLAKNLRKIAAGSHEPIGVSMSGGVDSALIAALLVQEKIPVQGLTVGYKPLTRNDETQAASETAQQIGFPIEVFKVSDEDISSILDCAIKSFPEPLGDATVLPQLLMTLSAKGKVAAIIDGTGADNIFGGMQKFTAERYAMQYLRIPRFLRVNLIRPVLNMFNSSRKSSFTDQVRKMQKFAYGVEMPARQQKVYWSRFMDQKAVEGIIAQALSPDGRLADEILMGIRDEVPVGFDDFYTSSYASIRGTMPTHAAQKLVTLQYASGSFYHTPFMTPDLIEFALSLPVSFKLSARETKVVLRRTYSKILPTECTNLKKATFSPPIGRWLMGVLRTEFMDLLKGNEFFTTDTIQKMISEQDAGRRDWQWELWLVYIFLKWFKEVSR